MVHRCGTMSFARKWEEEREKNPNGQEPDRMHMFYITYTLFDGLFPRPKASMRYAQMEHLTQPTNGEEAFTDVMGRIDMGGPRCMGLASIQKFSARKIANVMSK